MYKPIDITLKMVYYIIVQGNKDNNPQGRKENKWTI